MNSVVTLKNNQSQKSTSYHTNKTLFQRRQRTFTGKRFYAKTDRYYYEVRYLDPKTSRWLGVDPAMHQGDYIPSAPIDDEARERNGNLPGQGGIYNYINMHVYHYAGNNPVKYVDPDGRLQRDKKNGELIFWPRNTNQDGSMRARTITGNSEISIEVVYGHVKANDGTEIIARLNLSESVTSEDFNCHGYTFTDGSLWINNDQIENLLKGDGYTKTKSIAVDDVMIQRNKDGEIIHSAIVKSVDFGKGEVKVREAMGVTEFRTNDNRKTRLRDQIYKLDGSNGILEFYKRPSDRIMEE